MRGAVVAGLSAVMMVPSVSAQIPGVCVSGCDIPSMPSGAIAAPTPPDPRFNIIGARAVVAQGDIKIRTPDGRLLGGAAAFNGAIPLGSIVVTGPGAKLQLLLPDETLFTIGPNSEMVLDDFVYDPVTSLGKLSARVVKGAFRFVTGKIARKDPERMKVKLNVGVIGIRGTDFEIIAEPDGSGYVLLNLGAVDLTEYDTQRVHTLRPGQRLRFENFRIIGIE